MAEREREMAERRHEIELFSKKRQIDLEKMHEENRKRLVEAKMQEINLMDDESLLLETATNSSSKHGSIYSTKSENRVKDWVESVGSQKTAILMSIFQGKDPYAACYDCCRKPTLFLVLERQALIPNMSTSTKMHY